VTVPGNRQQAAVFQTAAEQNGRYISEYESSGAFTRVAYKRSRTARLLTRQALSRACGRSMILQFHSRDNTGSPPSSDGKYHR